MKKIILTMLVLILVACSAGGTDFSRNQQKWTDANIQHYRFSLNVGCFCVFRDQMPLSIEVLNGEPVSITAADGSLVDATDPNYQFYEPYVTIDKLFSELEANQAGGADEVTVTYDATYGFPSETTFDFVKDATDDELYLSAYEFEALP